MIESAFGFFVLGWLSGLFTTVVIAVMYLLWESHKWKTIDRVRKWGDDS